METQGSVCSAIRSQEWTVSIDIRDAYLHVPMHQAVHKYLRFVVNKQVYQFFRFSDIAWELTKLLRPVVALLRQQGVKLHVYLDDRLIRADTQEQAKLHAQTTISVLQFLGWIINYEKSDLTPSRDFQFIRMQFNTRQFTVTPQPKMRLKVQSVHQPWMTNSNITARDLHRLLGMLVFMASLVRRGRLRLGLVGRHSMVPEDRELVRSDHSSSVVSVRGGLVGISSSPARSTPRLQGDGSDSLHGCVQFGLGSPARLTLDMGTVVSISKIMAHQRSGDAGRHQRYERLPASSEVPGGSLDVRQRSDCGLHQERGGHEIAHFDADDHTTAQVVRPQGNYVGSHPSARSAQHPGGFPVQSQPDTDHGVDDGHGECKTRVCQVGRAAGRLVCDIRQQTTHQVCIAVSGSQGGVDRCHVHALGQWEGPPVRVPAIQDGPSSTAEDRSVTRSQGDSDCSTATGSFVVSGVDGSVPRRSDPAVRRGSRPADLRRVDRRRGDGDLSLPAVKSTRVETLQAILRAKGHSREAARMMSGSVRESSLQVYESHWARFVAFCRSKRWQAFRLERPVQRRIMPMWDLHLVLLSLLRPPFASNSDVDGESSDNVIPLKWRTMKCVFLLALARTCTHWVSRPADVCSPEETPSDNKWYLCCQNLVFLAKNQLPTQAPEWITVPGIAHLNPTEAERCCALSDSWNSTVTLSADVYTMESQYQRYHAEPHKPMDRGDCQGSLHSSWSRVWPIDGTWGHSPFSFMSVQLSGSPTWHPVSGILEVIWGLPEFVSTRHGLYRWWHVYTGSSGGRTTSSGSRTSSPSSIAYMICMQPLLPCS